MAAVPVAASFCWANTGEAVLKTSHGLLFLLAQLLPHSRKLTQVMRVARRELSLRALPTSPARSNPALAVR